MTTSKPHPEIKTFSPSFPEISICDTSHQDFPPTDIGTWLANMQAIVEAAKARLT